MSIETEAYLDDYVFVEDNILIEFNKFVKRNQNNQNQV